MEYHKGILNIRADILSRIRQIEQINTFDVDYWRLGDPQGSEVEDDVNFVSYVKESSVFGAVGGAAMQLEGSSIVAEGLTYEAICLCLAITLVLVFCCRRSKAGMRPPTSG